MIRTARWVVSQTNVSQRTNPRAIFHKVFIDIVSTCVIFSLAARTVQPASPSLFSSSCKTTCDSLPPSVSTPLSTDTKHSTVMYVCGGIFPLHLGTECSHSVYFFVFYVLVASSNYPSVVFLCTQGYLHITSHYIPQCTKKHISYSS